VKTILVVDDEPAVMRLIATILTNHGYLATEAANAAEALALLDGSPGVELVITDQHMDGMTGLELAAALRADARFRDVPVILCTGAADRATIAEATTLGIRHLIAKPVTPKVVMDKVLAVEGERLQ
jgi:CheY-like chemotaxis protein